MAKLRVLCLHGSRQSSEIFSQRIRVLTRKLQDVAELHFVEAPHELPLMEGQSVPMRAWWRHGGFVDSVPEGAGDASKPDWDAQVVTDWHASLQVLEGQWRNAGGYDAILGFSNGAAATFLLAAHVLARPADFPGRRLKCAIMAGGYLPQPLDRLLPQAMRTQAAAGANTDGSEHAPPLVLAAPLRLASLHTYSPQDKYVSIEQSKQLATQFDMVQKMEHDSGHCVPQKANQVSTILDFLSWFEPPPEETAPPDDQQEQQPPSPPPHQQDQQPQSHMSQQQDQQEPASLDALSLKEQPGARQPSQDGEAHAGCQGASQPELPGISSPEQPACATPSAEQQEEIEALQAIFEGCCVQLPSTEAVRLRVRLRDPSTLQQDADADAAVLQACSPSSLFAVDCTLPEGYPSGGMLPSFSVPGPPLPPDQQGSLAAHLDAVARENVIDMGQACIFQVVEAAKEWLDSNLPADFVRSYASRNWSSSHQQQQQQHQSQEAEAKAAPPWWENEEADAELVARAITEASASRDWLLSDTSRPHAAEGGSVGCMQVAEAADSMQHGRWEYIVGLVGKPSAGKSSFFNAVTQPVDEDEGARVAAFPFTTIDPQTGRGFAVVPDPCNLLGPEIASRCKPLHGFAPAFNPARASQELNNTQPLHNWASAMVGGSHPAWRRVPIAIKDVAGLVPGAYQGRGRGNAFLNDLTQASVLVHVVDASGCTDQEGRNVAGGGTGPSGPEGGLSEGGDPVADIGWVRQEIHRWVYNNVRTKWGAVRRRPSKLCDLFSGYHAARALVYQVLEHVVLSVNALLLNTEAATATLCAWTEADLHRLVATFLAARFPILLALNKCDTPSAHHHIRRIREALPNEPTVSMSAASERWLLSSARKGQVLYQDGADSASPSPGCEDVARQVAGIQKRVLEPFGSTGALLAISTAVAMRPPSLVFPVSDLTTCAALPARNASAGGVLLGGEDAKARAAEGNSPSVLRDALLMLPGSTPADLFAVLHRPPWLLLEGEFVRAEARLLQAFQGKTLGSGGAAGEPSAFPHTVLKKGDQLTPSNCIVRVMTNRKSGGGAKGK